MRPVACRSCITSLRNVNGNLLGDHGRIMRNMRMIAQDQLQCVLARQQVQRDLGLAPTEMDHVLVGGQRLVLRR